MASKRTNPLYDRLTALGIFTFELADMIRRPVEEVEAWIKGKEPDGEAKILLRVLDDDHVATLAVERIRNTVTRDMRGEGMEYAGLDPADMADNTPPVQTGGRPQ